MQFKSVESLIFHLFGICTYKTNPHKKRCLKDVQVLFFSHISKKCTKFEICAVLHRFHTLYISHV